MQVFSWFQVQARHCRHVSLLVFSGAALSCFQVHEPSWFWVQASSWFRMQLILHGFAVVIGATPSVVLSAADSCLRMQKHVVTKAPPWSNPLIYGSNFAIFSRLTS